MDKYLTAIEMAEMWCVSLRTVQVFCKNGKIEGAVKRAGSWFIPKDAPNPVRESKEDDEKFPFTGMKKKLFDGAILLFSMHGFENVSIRDIGDAANAAQSAIYRYFSSKQEILDLIYDYYSENFFNNRISVKDMKELLKNGTKVEFCSALMFNFDSEDKEKEARMFLITKIIYMRIFQDTRACDIFLGMMNNDTENYVKEILEYGVSIKVLKEFDIATYVKFLVGQRQIMGIRAFVDPNYRPVHLEEEQRIMKMSADLLPFVDKV